MGSNTGRGGRVVNDTTFQGDGSVKYVPVVVNAKPKPITNADAVRAMTDEELACFINEIEAEAIKRAGRYLTKTEIERGKAQRLDWLRQEADDEN